MSDKDKLDFDLSFLGEAEKKKPVTPPPAPEPKAPKQSETNVPKPVLKIPNDMANLSLTQAGLGGGFGAVLAGILWYWFVQMSQNEIIGVAAIGVGFLIGYSVYWGSGLKRGLSLQIMSAVLTLITLYTSNYFIVMHSLKKYAADHPAWLPGNDINYISPFSPDIVQVIISPTGLLIWGIGIYFAFQIPKPKPSSS